MTRRLDTFRTSLTAGRAALLALSFAVSLHATTARAQIDSLPVPDTLSVPAATPLDADTLVATPDTVAALPDTGRAAPPEARRKDSDSPIALRGHGRPNPIKSVIQNAKNFVSDGIYLYTSPLRMSAKNLVWTGGVAAVG